MHTLNLPMFFDKIFNIDYAITKIDVPYNPKDFPSEYAIGKDLDIFVSYRDFQELKSVTIEYFKQYYNQFEIKLLSNANNFRLRMEQGNHLHYQIDITQNDTIIKDKLKKSNYYILSLENESKIRKNELIKNPHKKHHRDWLVKNNYLT